MNLTSKGGQQVGIFPGHAAGQQSDEVLVEGHAEVVVDKAGCKERHKPALLGLVLQHCLLLLLLLANPSTKLTAHSRVTDSNDNGKVEVAVGHVDDSHSAA